LAGLVTLTPAGLYCPSGDFYIDPWRAVNSAVLTHGHADHARTGSKNYLALDASAGILRQRLGQSISLETLAPGQVRRFGEAEVSLHAAGHILGSAQVRIACGHAVTVVTGDFKRTPDPSCAPFETVLCDTLITEATFALPIYRWPDPREVAADIYRWWQLEAARGRAVVLCCYSLGKAQRILAELMQFTDRTVFLHGAMVPLTQIYRDQGVAMLPTLAVTADIDTPRHPHNAVDANPPRHPHNAVDANSPRHPRESGDPGEVSASHSGVQGTWVPAFAGMTISQSETADAVTVQSYRTDMKTDSSAAPTPRKRARVAATKQDFAGELILAPPSVIGTSWMQRFGAYSTGFASGWMAVRGNRRRQSYDRGFVLSDHADWDGLIQTIRESGAKKVYATHGNSEHLTRYLCELGIDAQALKTEFGDQGDSG
jgi:DNA ligase-associated putative exonuclease